MDNFKELSNDDLLLIDGGHWYCEVAAVFAEFCEGFSDAFGDGYRDARDSNPF